MTARWHKTDDDFAFDPRWRTVARKAGAKVGDVVAIVTALYSFASRNVERGSIAGFDIEVVADAYGYDRAMVESVFAALIEKAIIVGEKVIDWICTQGNALSAGGSVVSLAQPHALRPRARRSDSPAAIRQRRRRMRLRSEYQGELDLSPTSTEISTEAVVPVTPSHAVTGTVTDSQVIDLARESRSPEKREIDKKERDEVSNLMTSFRAGARFRRHDGPDLADPAVRRQVWQQNVMNFMFDTGFKVRGKTASEIIVAYCDNEPWAIAAFEIANVTMAARKKAA